MAGTWLVHKDADAKDSLNLVEAAHIDFDAEGTGHLENFKDGERQGDPIPFFVTRTAHGSYLNLNTGTAGKDAKAPDGGVLTPKGPRSSPATKSRTTARR